MSARYSEPRIDKTEFNCPRCGVRATQHWLSILVKEKKRDETPSRLTHAWIDEVEQARKKDSAPIPQGVVEVWRREADGDVFTVGDGGTEYGANAVHNLSAARCGHCSGLSVWLKSDMVFPLGGEVPAHEDMPESVKPTFNESSKILSASPRASAALSRLALQELCLALGCEAQSLDKQIGELVARGLSKEMEMMLDSVRVIGNNAVHPGEIDLRDNHETARFLLECINRICQRLITEKRQIESLYDMLPQGAKDAIERRNAKILAAPVSQEINEP